MWIIICYLDEETKADYKQFQLLVLTNTTEVINLKSRP